MPSLCWPPILAPKREITLPCSGHWNCPSVVVASGIVATSVCGGLVLADGTGAAAAVLGGAGFTAGARGRSDSPASIVGDGAAVAGTVAVAPVGGCAVVLAPPAAGDRSSIAIDPPVEVVTRGGAPA